MLYKNKMLITEYQLYKIGDSLIELGKWMDAVEQRLIREGKLRIVDGKYIWLNDTKIN